MPTYTFNLFYVPTGEVDQSIKLFDIAPNDTVTVKATTISTIDWTVLPLGYGEGFTATAFSNLPDALPSFPGNTFGAFNGSDPIIRASNFWVDLVDYEATRHYGTTSYSHSDSTGSSYTGFLGSNEALYLSIYTPWGAAENLTPDYVLVSVSLTTNRAKPDLPTQFTQEQKDKFLADAQTIDKLSVSLKALGSSLDPLSAPISGLNWMIDQYIKAAAPAMSPASATAQTMPAVTFVANKLTEKLPELNPVALTLSVATVINQRVGDLLKFLANDPPDLNYSAVLDFPHDIFTPINGVSVAGNALLESMYKMVGDLTEMLAAAERFQGAAFAGNESFQVAQEAAFDAALSAYNQRRVAVSQALDAFLAEAAVADMNFEDDVSLTQAASFFSGITNAADNEILNDLVSVLTDPYLPDTGSAAVVQALLGLFDDPDTAPSLEAYAPITLLGDTAITEIRDAIANATASSFSGSVLDALAQIKDALSSAPPPPPPTGPEVAVSGNGLGIADDDTTPDAGDGTAFGTHLVGEVVTHTFTVTNIGTADLKTSALKLPNGFKLGTDKLASTIAPGASDTFTVLLDTSKVGSFAGVLSFTTNDPDEKAFNFNLSAEVTAPEIAVTGNARNIADNDKSPALTDHTDFGTSAYGEAGAIRTFSITNSGNAALTITSITAPAGFALLGGIPTLVAAGATETDIGVPAEVFRRRVDHDVGAELERSLQVRGGERVVDDEQRAGCVGCVSRGAKVDDVEQRVGG